MVDLVDEAGIGVDAAVVPVASRCARPSDDHVIAVGRDHRAAGRLAEHAALVLRGFEVADDAIDLGQLRPHARHRFPHLGLVTFRSHADDLRRGDARAGQQADANGETTLDLRHLGLVVRKTLILARVMQGSTPEVGRCFEHPAH